VIRRPQILVVEDSPSDVRLLQEAMKEAPVRAQIDLAQDGAEAVVRLRRAEAGRAPVPDLILLDLNLPKKSGLEVLAEIKDSSKLSHIPVIVMSSSRSDEDIAQAYAMNANCYIPKPADLDRYIAVVCAVINFWFFTATLPETRSVSPDSQKLRPAPPASTFKPAYAVE
jgi:chemotaxis family two-component system response regulator Rcp1